LRPCWEDADESIVEGLEGREERNLEGGRGRESARWWEEARVRKGG
jgi:hypothetical protein